VTVSDKVREAVLERDGYSCAGCGYSIVGRQYSLQHRRAKKRGGSRLPWIDQPQNLITLCGSATSPDGCHLRAESRGLDAQTLGYVISEWPELDPRFIPVHVVGEFGTSKVWLTPGGGLSNEAPADAVEFQDLLFCPSCRVVKLHHFEGDTAACIRCASVQHVNPALVVPVIEVVFCPWCRATLPASHACVIDADTRCLKRRDGVVCGICRGCLAATQADPRYGSPSDLDVPA
jgi:5-methylcytosine-specific restriction protein A